MQKLVLIKNDNAHCNHFVVKKAFKVSFWIFDTRHLEYTVGYKSLKDAENTCTEWNEDEKNKRARLELVS